MDENKRDQRLSLRLSKSEMEKLNDIAEAMHMTRTAAIVQLILAEHSNIDKEKS